MKKNSFVVIILLLTTVLGSSLLLQTTVDAYEIIGTNDMILYKIDFNWYEAENFSELPNTPTEKVHDHKNVRSSSAHDIVMCSYNIQSGDEYYVFAEHTATYYEDYRYWSDEWYSYDYMADTWVEDGKYEDMQYMNINWSWYEEEYLDVFNGTLNFDAPNNFNMVSYSSSHWENFTLNGIEQELYVDHYSYYTTWTNTWTNWCFDIEYTMTSVEEKYYEYYIDPNTGMMIKYLEKEDRTETGNFYEYSTELAQYIEREESRFWCEEREWNLYECTNVYYPVIDADIPQLLLWNNYFTIDDTTSLITLEFDTYDWSNDITVEYYLNQEFLGVFYYSNGHYMIDIPISEFEYYMTYFRYHIELVVYEDAEPNHNSTWCVDIIDNRLVIPDWPTWYEGPDYLKVEEWKHLDQEYMVFSDTQWAVQIYRVWFDGYSNQYDHWDWFEGYGNSSFWLHHPPEYPGTFEYQFEFWDTSGIYLNKTVIVDVGDGPIPGQPIIDGPDGIMDYEFESGKILTYKFKDDDPRNFQVLLDTIEIASGSYYDGMIWDFIVDNHINAIGKYILEIKLDDYSGHTSKLILELNVSEDGESTETKTDDKTLGIDAPNVLIATLSILSLAALATTVKRKI